MLNAATVTALARTFGLGEVMGCDGPVARGEVGEVFDLRTTGGRWAVKRPFGAWDETGAARTTAFAERARTRGIRTPAARRTLDGRVGLDTPDGRLRVHVWVDLDGGEDSGLDPAAVGRLVAGLHQVPGDDRGGAVDEWFTASVGAARWDVLAASLSRADAPFARDLVALRPAIDALEALLRPPADLRMCHRDLFADNLRRGADGKVWVLDFDSAGPADPAQELAMVLYDIGGGDPDRARVIHDAYRRADGPALVSAPGDFSMAIATLGHINERACARWLAAPAGDPERDRMAALFGEFVDRPLTVAVIEETLAALR